MSYFIKQLKSKLTAAPSKFWAVLIAIIALSCTLFALFVTLNLVIVTDSYGARKVLITTSVEPGALMNLSGIEAGEFDDVFYTAYAGNLASLNIQRAFSLTVQVDDKMETVYLSAGTVQNALEQLGVVLSKEDYTEPSLHTEVAEGMQIMVHRVEYRDTVLEEAIAPGVTYQLTPLIRRSSKTYVLREGVPGLSRTTYRQRVVDGEVESAIALQTEIIKPAVDAVVLKKGNVPISDVSGPEVVNNVPIGYTQVLQNAVCTGYSSKAGRGASRLGLYAGTVAVNPNEIPYGTKLYITSADGSFVYGYAVATDTGTALMQGIIDVDLFFESYLESVLCEKRILNVYIMS